MSGKLTNQDMIFLAKLPLSDEQLTELLKWASTYEEEEEPKRTSTEEIKSIFKCDTEEIKE
jgi:hypothetical protein